MGIVTAIGSIVGLVADFGVSSLISNVSTTFATKSGNKILDKVMIGVGGAVLAGMAGEAAQSYIEKKTEKINEFISGTQDEEDEEVTEDEREVSE